MKRIFLGTFVLFALATFSACSTPGDSPRPSDVTTTKPAAIWSMTATVSPLSTPYPSKTPVFTYPTMELVWDEPTEIALPAEESDQFQLKAWDEDRAIELIKLADKFAADWNVKGPSLSRGAFRYQQYPVELVLQETISKFHDSSNNNDYLWHLAYSEFITGKRDSEYWLMTTTERALNSREYTPENLDSLYKRYGFVVVRAKEVSNLFNDHTTGWVFQVTTDTQSRDGLFFAIRVSSAGYSAIRLTSQHYYDNGNSSIYFVNDINVNGIPDVVLSIGSHSGTICGRMIEIFEWNGEKFEDITDGLVGLECSSTWVHGIEPETGVPYIKIIYGFNYDPGYDEIMTWDGKHYIFDSYIDAPPLYVWRDSVARKRISPAKELGMLEEMPQSPDVLQNEPPGRLDFLRFRLGFLYALTSQPDKARDIFNTLIDEPADKQIKIYSTLATRFLSFYHEDASIYKACKNTNLVLPRNPAVYGFSDNFVSYRLIVLCDEMQAFKAMVRSIPSEKDLKSELNKYGAHVIYMASADFNGDGRQEWIVFYRDGVTVIGRENDRYFAKLPSELPGQTLYVVRGTDAPSKLEVFSKVDGSFSVVVVHYPSKLLVFRVKENLEIEGLIWADDVARVVVTPTDDLPQLQIFHRWDSRGWSAWEGYRWNPMEDDYSGDLLEYILFTEKDFEKAKHISDTLVPELERWHKIHSRYGSPDLYYLSALSYELSGDEATAVELYWKIWHDFPDSAYALMARFKLEPVAGPAGK